MRTTPQVPILVINAGYISPGVSRDGGGIIIYLGADGKIHVKKVGPGPGDPYRVLAATATTLAALEGHAGADEEMLREAARTVFVKSANALAREMENQPDA